MTTDEKLELTHAIVDPIAAVMQRMLTLIEQLQTHVEVLELERRQRASVTQAERSGYTIH